MGRNVGYKSGKKGKNATAAEHKVSIWIHLSEATITHGGSFWTFANCDYYVVCI